MELETLIIAIIATFLAAVATFLLGRRISERAEIMALDKAVLHKEVKMITDALLEARETTEKKDEEITSLKSALEEREAKIAELKERLKFAEKVTDRDYDRMQTALSEMLHVLRTLKEDIEKLRMRTERGAR